MFCLKVLYIIDRAVSSVPARHCLVQVATLIGQHLVQELVGTRAGVGMVVLWRELGLTVELRQGPGLEIYDYTAASAASRTMAQGGSWTDRERERGKGERERAKGGGRRRRRSRKEFDEEGWGAKRGQRNEQGYVWRETGENIDEEKGKCRARQGRERGEAAASSFCVVTWRFFLPICASIGLNTVKRQ